MPAKRTLCLSIAILMAVPAAPVLAAPIYSLEIFTGNGHSLELDYRYASDGSYVEHQIDGGNFHAYLVVPPNPPVPLTGLPAGYFNSIGSGVSDNHKVSGYISSASNANAFYWDANENGGLIRDIGNLGGTLAVGMAVNNSGQVAGYSSTGSTGYRAFLWEESTGMINLGLLDGDTHSYAYDINNAGQVVGYSVEGLNRRAVLWEEGDIFDLNTLLDDSGIGYQLTFAYGINHDGWILAEGRDPTGTPRQFLLKPVSLDDPTLVPVPGMMALFGLGVLLLSVRRSLL